jgi:phosphoglycolate phosphatase
MIGRPDIMLFDLDGTLIDSVPDIAAATNKMLDDRGLPCHDADVIRGWVGRGLSILVHRALAGGGNEVATPSDHAEAVQIFRHHYSSCCTRNTVAFDGASELLDWLPSVGVRTAVVTNKPSSFAVQIVEAIGLVTNVLVGADPGRPLKPDPASLHEAVELLGGGTAWMVGDTSFDRDAAHAAGMQFIGVQLEGDQGRNIAEITADDEPVFESLRDLHAWLRDEVQA